MTTIASTSLPAVDRRGPRWPAVAGFTYVGAWVVGLAAFGAGPASDASPSEVARHFADHRVASAMQSLLVHGVAAIALAAVVVAVHRSRTFTRTAYLAGLLAVGLSLVQCGLGLWRSLASTGSTTNTLVDTINRVDGFKMFALAVMIGASIVSLRSTDMIGRRMAATGRLATIALVVSGVAYAGGITALQVSAAPALVLLLVWVGFLGFAAAQRTA